MDTQSITSPSGYVIGAIALTLLLYAFMLTGSYIRDRIHGLRPPFHTLLFEPLKKPWVLFTLSVWMILVILAFVYSGAQPDDTYTLSKTVFLEPSVGQRLPVDVSITGDDVFAKGRNTFLKVAASTKNPQAANIATQLQILEYSTLKLTHVVSGDNVPLRRAPEWHYIATPIADGHSVIVLKLCAARTAGRPDCTDWNIPIYVQRLVVSPGYINPANWSAIIAVLTSLVGLIGGASQLGNQFFKKRQQPAVQPNGAASASATASAGQSAS